MLRIFAFDDQGQRSVADPEEISDLIARDGTLVWADLSQATADDLALVEKEFALHPLAIEDASKNGQRPKLELYDGHAFLVAYVSTNNHRSLNEVDLFIGPNWLITSHETDRDGAHFDIDVVRGRCERYAERVTITLLLYTVLDEIVDSYFAAIELLGDQIDEIEDRIFGDEDPEIDERPIQREMLNVRKQLLDFRRKVVPLREVLLMLLRDDLQYIDSDAHHYFQDVFDHIMRVTDEIDSRRELIGNAVDAHLAMVSNQMNSTMKKMTSWGAILIVSTLISGIFGMNFVNMPPLVWEFGFLLSLLSMVAATVGLYLYFKKRRWI